MLAQPAELVKRGGEIAARAEKEREERMFCASAAGEGGGEAGHSLFVRDLMLGCRLKLLSTVQHKSALIFSKVD